MTNEETLGWHRIIRYEHAEKAKEAPRRPTGGWRTSKETLTSFQDILSRKVSEDTGASIPTSQNYRRFAELVTASCDESFPKRKASWGSKKEVYWWSECIKEKRKICMRSRRRLTRINRNGTDESKLEAAREYKEKKENIRRKL